MNSIIGVKNLDKTYGKNDSAFKALKDISLNIKQGESVAIIGKSGSGKSTLMHLIALLDSPSKGEITIDNKISSNLSIREKDRLRNKKFGFVFQQFFLNANNTVLDNVILPLKIAGVSRKRRNQRGLEVLEDVELVDKAKNKANNLSGGEKQRVVIARALVNNPSIIFADEPTGNLDSVTGAKIENMLFSMNKLKKITLIIVTHDKELAARCDRQIRLKDGEIIEDKK
ncbi:MAG: ABC transporter ATP-binding protein [Candidatus Saccharibacteria bacterium]